MLIAHACAMNTLGINHGKAGNVSLRWDRSNTPQGAGLLITPSALAYDQLEPRDIVWLSMRPDPDRVGMDSETPPDTPVFDGERRASSEWRMHRDLLRARPELAAVVHTHSRHAAALSCLPRVQSEGIPPFHYMIALSGAPRIACAGYARFGTKALSEAMLAALAGGAKACLLAHHGLIAAGHDLPSALALAEEVEALAAMYAITLTLGGPAILDQAAMDAVEQAFAAYRSGQAL
jgi:L-fuculose-phosphate aldolase